MTRIVLPILGALLAAFSSVDAKSKKDQIHLYQFEKGQCLEAPKGGNVDLERDQCTNLDARSVKAALNPTRTKWLDDVNNDHIECFLAVYSEPFCKGDSL